MYFCQGATKNLKTQNVSFSNLYLSKIGSQWQPIAVNGSQWQSMAVNGSHWQSMAVNFSQC